MEILPVEGINVQKVNCTKASHPLLNSLRGSSLLFSVVFAEHFSF